MDGWWHHLEVSPLLAGQSQRRRLKRQNSYSLPRLGPNLFIKIPGTPKWGALSAIEETIMLPAFPSLLSLLFSRDQYLKAAGAYMRGIERRIKEAGLNPAVHSRLPSIFISRWDKAVTGKEPEGSGKSPCALQSPCRRTRRIVSCWFLPQWLQLAGKRRLRPAPALGKHRHGRIQGLRTLSTSVVWRLQIQ